jgi:hypothetical protein
MVNQSVRLSIESHLRLTTISPGVEKSDKEIRKGRGQSDRNPEPTNRSNGNADSVHPLNKK